MRASLRSALVMSLLVACDPAAPAVDAGDAAMSDAGRADAGGSDAGADDGADIEEALACGSPGRVGGVGAAGELELYALDPAVFPDALCNDGSAAIVYYRPYRGEANRDRWVISLRGGGACGSAASCAARWCACQNGTRCPFASELTDFSLDNMSGGGRRGRPGGGVMLRDARVVNPLADYNHVQFLYCSSDAWAGNARSVSLTTTHPRTGVEVTYTAHFLGARILEADLSVLRQEGIGALRYTLDGGSTAMPDLDEATEVVMVGDSAGGAGMIHQLDAIADLLRAEHTGAGTVEVVGIIDAATGPDWSRLDFTGSIGVPLGIDTYAEAVQAIAGGETAVGASRDASCVAYHASRPGTEAQCSDLTHVVRHHVTTPFFVRMALLDSSISQNYESNGLSDPALGPFVDNAMGLPAVFAQVLQPELAAFPMLGATAEEGAAITVAPGVFAPSCTNHDTIHEDTEVFGVTITPTSGGATYRFFDVFGAWRFGAMPSAVLSSDPMRRDTSCP